MFVRMSVCAGHDDDGSTTGKTQGSRIFPFNREVLDDNGHVGISNDDDGDDRKQTPLLILLHLTMPTFLSSSTQICLTSLILRKHRACAPLYLNLTHNRG